MDVLEKTDPEAATSRGENKPLKSFFEAPATGTVLKQPSPGSSSRIFKSSQAKSPVKKAIVVSLVLFAVISAGSAAWYFFVSPNTSQSSVSRAISRNVSKPVKPAGNFSWSTPRSAGTASASRSVPGRTGVLQGVILDSAEPLCLIEGKILKVGDVWEDKKITAITGQGVSLADKQGNASFIGITN